MSLSTRRLVLAEGVQEVSDGTFDNILIQLVAGRAANLVVATASGDIAGTDLGHVLTPNTSPAMTLNAFIASGQKVYANTSEALAGSILAITEY